MRRLILSMMSFVGFASLAFAEEPAVKVSYYKEVRPLFQLHCQGCHQPAKANGSYIMTDYASLFQAGDSGKNGVVAGKPKESYLLDEIRVVDGKSEMPKKGNPLTTEQYQLIEKWIVEGATDDTPASAKVKAIDADHPPVYQSPPVITSIVFSPDGKLLAVTGYHETLIYAYNNNTLKLQSRLVGLSERVQSLAFSPDGKLLAAAAGDPGRFGEIQVWDVEKEKLKLSAPVTADTVYGVSWSPDAKMIAFGCIDNTVRGIDPNTGEQTLQMGTHSDWVLGTIFSRDGLNLASVSRDMSMKMTEVATQRFVDNITSITPGALKGGLMTVDVRPITEKKLQVVPNDTPGVPPKNYDELLIGGSDGVPRLYKMHRETKRVIGDDANKIRQYESMPGRISSAVFDRTGKRFAAASSLDGQGEVAVYNTDADKKVITLKDITGPVYTVAWTADGQSIASAGFDGKVWLHDPNTGKVQLSMVVLPK